MSFYFNAILKPLCLLSSCVVLFACVSSDPIPNTYYYVLENEAVSEANLSKQDAKQVKVAHITLPDYMKQPNLVLKLSDHQIKLANYHLWAEDLHQSIRRILIKDLNQQHANVHFSQHCSDCDVLSISIDHFYPTEDGKVILSGSYELRSPNDDIQQKGFSLSADLEKGGYDEAVSQMRLLLKALVVELEV